MLFTTGRACDRTLLVSYRLSRQRPWYWAAAVLATTTFEGTDAKRALEYRSLSLKQRLQIAAHLVEAFGLLALVGFVHGDINPQNSFVNVSECCVAVIDFDSGAMVEQAGDQPTSSRFNSAATP